MKKTSYSSLLICALILSGCSKSSPSLQTAPNSTVVDKIEQDVSNKKISSSITLKRMTEFEDNFSNIEEFKENLNKYIIQADFTGTPGEKTFSCETQSSPHDKLQFQITFGNDSQVVEKIIDLNKTIAQVETIHCSVNSEIITSVEANFEIKKDLLIDHSEDIEEKLVDGKNIIGTLVFAEGVVAQTNGRNLNLKVDRLIATNSTLTSYKGSSLRAPDNSDGRSGGLININAGVAIGSLKIVMRGQDGGLVTKVPGDITDIPGIDSSFNGIPMIAEKTQTCMEREGSGRDHCYWSVDVTQCPTDGKKGIKGHKGYKAYPGRNAGNSGVVSVSVADGTLFNLEIELIKGFGSNPSRPGKGGPGSIGGHAGSFNQSLIAVCGRAPIDGARGENGDSGDEGVIGKNGIIERATYSDAKNSIKEEY